MMIKDHKRCYFTLLSVHYYVSISYWPIGGDCCFKMLPNGGVGQKRAVISSAIVCC